MPWFRTPWKLVSSAGLDLSAGELVQINAGGTGLRFQHRNGTRFTLGFGYGGAGVGVGLTPIQVDLSTFDMPSGGIGPVFGKTPNLAMGDFEGGITFIDFQLAGAVSGGAAYALTLGQWLPAPLSHRVPKP